MKRFVLSVKGVVQGVGFRPFVYNLAREIGIRGYITNTSAGVVIDAEGDDCTSFIETIRLKHPPLSRIDSVDVQELPPKGYDDFVIISSLDNGGFTLVSPDVSVCGDCLKELFDPLDRRYLYPFINCTNCGPRYSITQRVPYDRPNTTMAHFDMCPECLREYNDPANRRFHAQPNACPVCGPQVSLRVLHDSHFVQAGAAEAGNPVSAAIALLKQGAVVAVKGLGGFHLCCDASNEQTVALLRERKRKSNKPFALMAPDSATVRKFCELGEQEETLLNSMKRPVVLLKKGAGITQLSGQIAPGNKYLGFMLPYTPLHYLLFHYPVYSSHFDALVMTSGNISEEPIVIDNNEAIDKLGGMADAFLFHNRDIFMRVDDSVVRAKGHGQKAFSFIRRSRGYAPEPVLLEEEGPDVLGCGADVKNSFTLTKGSYAVISQHIGDMENLETLRFFEETLANLKQVYRAEPVAIAYDLHPGYLSAQWAMEQCRKQNIAGYAVQHHYAHIAAILAESGLTEKVIGIALDGTGYGTDGNLWGGEFLVCGIDGYVRAAHFDYIPLPGGERAIKECWRTAIGAAVAAFSRRLNDAAALDAAVMESLNDIGFVERYGLRRVESIVKLAGNRNFSPLSSGAGRLFDAVSALASVSDRNTFEGEAAIALENEVEEGITDAYEFTVMSGQPLRVDFADTVLQIMDDVRRGEAKGRIAARFHNAIIEVISTVAVLISGECGIRTVALSGGTFQNSYVFEGAYDRLVSQGFNVLTNVNVPCNDACISLGQAFLLRERLKAGLPLKD